MNHPLDSQGSAYDDLFNDLSTPQPSVYVQQQAAQQYAMQQQAKAQAHHVAKQQAQQQAQHAQQFAQQAQQHVQQHQHQQNHQQPQPQQNQRQQHQFAQSMILPTTGGNHSMYGTIPSSSLSSSSQYAGPVDSSGLTPNGGPDFLSQLGKTWNLIQSKAQELDAAKRKHHRTAKSLQEIQAEVESLRTREQYAAARVAEVESSSLVLTSENSRLKKEIRESRESSEASTSRCHDLEENLNAMQENLREERSATKEHEATIEALKRARDRANTQLKETEEKCERMSSKVEELGRVSEESEQRMENQHAELHREKSELSTHLWHVMEELKASERRCVGAEDVAEERKIMFQKMEHERDVIMSEKAETEGLLASLKLDVKETLARMQSEHRATNEELDETRRLLDAALRVKTSLKKQIDDVEKEREEEKTMVLIQKKEKKEEYVRKMKEATLALVEEKSELKEELQAARENVVRMTQSRDGLQEGMTSKRSELKAAREETSLTRRRAKEMEEKMDRINEESRKTHEKLQSALRKREEDLESTREQLATAIDRERDTQQTMSLSIQEAVTTATQESEERLGSEIALLNRRLTEESQKNEQCNTLIKEMEFKLKNVADQVRKECEEELQGLNDELTKKDTIAKETNQKFSIQKKKLMERVGAVEKAFTSFKQKSREQITSLTDNVGEQTKQLSTRINECERYRLEVETLTTTHEEYIEKEKKSRKNELEESIMKVENKYEREIETMNTKLEDTTRMSEGYKAERDELHAEVQELRLSHREHHDTIQQHRDESEKTIKECASQILGT